MVDILSKKIIVAVFILSLIALSFFVIWPIWLSIIGGLLLAYICYPIYRRVLRVVKEKNISALIVLLLLLIVIFLPLWFLLPAAARQIFNAYLFLQKSDLVGFLRNILPVTSSTDTLAILNTFVTNSISSVFSHLSDYLLQLPNILLQLVVVMFVFFFGMRDAERLKVYAKGISPFSPSVEADIVKQFEGITSSVIYGHILVGAIQGILTGIGLFITGVPSALLLTILAIFAAIIPVIGAWLVWIPASIYLFASGHTAAGIFLFLFGAIVISWIDNILRPYIVSRKSNISSGVVFVGMVGGLFVFGVIGLVLGPLILAYMLVLLDAYREKKLGEFFSK